MSPASASREDPTWLGEYELLTPIGRGGMGRVYLARGHRAHGVRRLVAVKVLATTLRDDPAAWGMLMDEARIGARIRHPNCVASHELAEHEGCPYVVMDYVNGPSLAGLLRKVDSLEPRLLVAVLLDALAGLHAAHETCDDFGNLLGLVHRDVSPGNILVDVSGSAFVTDFGISKAQERVTTTQLGVYKGKVRYLSPEQLTNPASIDRRSDVFSAGIVLFEALTNTVLFRHPDSVMATMQNILHREIPTASALRPQIPPSVDAVLEKALERDPDARFQTIEEMALALREAAADMGGIAPRNEIREVVREAWADELKRRADVCRLHALSESIPSSGTGSGSFTPRPVPQESAPSEERSAYLLPALVVLFAVLAGGFAGLVITSGSEQDIEGLPAANFAPLAAPSTMDSAPPSSATEGPAQAATREAGAAGEHPRPGPVPLEPLGGPSEQREGAPSPAAEGARAVPVRHVRPRRVRPRRGGAGRATAERERRGVERHSRRTNDDAPRTAESTMAVASPMRAPRLRLQDVETNPYTRAE